MRKKGVMHFFDKLEDRVRSGLSHYPIFYAFVGGIGIVLFWKGVWETAELFPMLHGPVSIVLGVAICLLSGLFVSFFIGDSIILSGYKHQKKLAEKTEEEITKDVDITAAIKQQLDRLESNIAELKSRSTAEGVKP